ncbi:hypothetical protein [Streptomyces sp. NBC_01750]|uniref:hypothetical protein n=1 Tax=Streptomyces sp. NBC_01750 TaxID=2975928 RepID=UPI002DD87EE6|nr:hypothetical protein [Streptomyces sp. NBC_01750]WSD38164.1 hypothetical protein OG966_40440 [Streptomyces sp. NBC_01750]
MSDDVTGADRAAWAAIALAAYNDEAPDHLLPLPTAAERERFGILAAEAMARTIRHNPADQAVNCRERADETIGDLIAYVFHLVDGRVTPDQLTRAAEEMRSPYPIRLDAVCVVAAADVDRVAAMLAALMEAAISFGCDVPAMLADSRTCYEEAKAEEEANEQTNA